jgi:hypothetical protein
MAEQEKLVCEACGDTPTVSITIGQRERAICRACREQHLDSLLAGGGDDAG